MHLVGDTMILLVASVTLDPSLAVILTRKNNIDQNQQEKILTKKKILTRMTRLGGGAI